jgi:hypothetical protein
MPKKEGMFSRFLGIYNVDYWPLSCSTSPSRGHLGKSHSLMKALLWIPDCLPRVLCYA